MVMIPIAPLVVPSSKLPVKLLGKCSRTQTAAPCRQRKMGPRNIGGFLCTNNDEITETLLGHGLQPALRVARFVLLYVQRVGASKETEGSVNSFPSQPVRLACAQNALQSNLHRHSYVY
jgi:hypothetical protein